MDSFLVARLERLLLGRDVSFWLSPQGKESVKQVFEGKESFKARVESVDDLGLWLRLSAKTGEVGRSLDSLLLLKWEYVATAQVSAVTGDSAHDAPKQERIQ